jgi:putative transposase
VFEVVYEHPIEPQPVDPAKVAGIDLGIDNLIALTSNQPQLHAVAVNGRIVKSINQYYNKHRARLQSYVGNRSSRKLRTLTTKRNRIIKHHLHVISRRVIDHLIKHGIGTLVIGYNAGWKQEANMGRFTNQTFVTLPHAQLVHMLTYKAQMAGIQVIEQEESYTSKCSFFDGESIKKHLFYAGKRVTRGLFRTKSGELVNADCNGAYNIIRKALPDAFSQGGGFPAHPMRVNLT